MKTLSFLTASVIALGLTACGGSSGSSSSNDQSNDVPSCPEAGQQPADACLAVGGGDFNKSKNGGFSYKIVFPAPHIYAKDVANQAVVVFDKNQCEGAMDAQGAATFFPKMETGTMNHGLGEIKEAKVRTVRDADCKNVFQVSEIYYPMAGEWNYYLRPKIVSDKADTGKVTAEVIKPQ